VCDSGVAMRFSLKAMLLLVTALGVFLGYNQWRRRGILDLSKQLDGEGYFVTVPSEWSDYIWQRNPFVGYIRVPQWAVVDRKTGTADFLEILRGGDELEKLKQLGVLTTNNVPY
jgi:hypothetical protein